MYFLQKDWATPLNGRALIYDMMRIKEHMDGESAVYMKELWK